MLKEAWQYFKKHKRPTIIAGNTILIIALAILIWKLIPEPIQDCKECFQQYEPFQQFNVNGQDYKVHEDLENPQLAAETMDLLNQTAVKLIDYLQMEYIDGNRTNMITPAKQKTVLYGIKSLKKNYKTANLEENIPERSGGDTSYVIDKGEIFAMCIRDPKNKNKIDPKINDLTFVLIHEMAHLFTKTFGHDKLFWENFRFLLKEANNIGVYEIIDYKKNKSPYCGILISYSPIYDHNLTDYFISS
jgi:predicted metal-dependent hydrolase